jgi:hypothetical protein
MSFESQGAPSDGSVPSGSRRAPFFFREEYSNLIVKGNFMTLAAKPKLVEEGEWLAHQGTPKRPISPCIMTMLNM